MPAGARVRCAAHKPAASDAPLFSGGAKGSGAAKGRAVERSDTQPPVASRNERSLWHIAQADSTAQKQRHTDPFFDYQLNKIS